jgi:hypothetical protein
VLGFTPTLGQVRVATPLLFTTFENFIFHEKLDEFVIIYIDDIFMYSPKPNG